jgi:hypothetical protein
MLQLPVRLVVRRRVDSIHDVLALSTTIFSPIAEAVIWLVLLETVFMVNTFATDIRTGTYRPETPYGLLPKQVLFFTQDNTWPTSPRWHIRFGSVGHIVQCMSPLANNPEPLPSIFSYNEIVSEVVDWAQVSRRNGLIYDITRPLLAKSALTTPKATLTIPFPQTQQPLLRVRSVNPI